MTLGGQLLGSWRADPPILVPVAAAAALYAAGVVRSRRWAPWRSACFVAGLATLLVALLSGIDDGADQLLSVHMVQHLLLALLAPALLLLSRPGILMLRALPPGPRRRVARVLGARATRLIGHPAAGLLVFSTAMLATHLTPLYGLALEHPAVHVLEHGIYLVAGLALWWPLLGGDPVPAHRLSGLGTVIYLLAAMPAMAVLGAWLSSSQTLAYPQYAAPARALGVSAVVDQQQAGALMWVGGDLLMIVVALSVAMAAMVREERALALRERYAETEASR